MSHSSVEKRHKKILCAEMERHTKKIMAVSNKFSSLNVTNFTKMFIFSVNTSEENLSMLVEGKVDEKSMSKFLAIIENL